MTFRHQFDISISKCPAHFAFLVYPDFLIFLLFEFTYWCSRPFNPYSFNTQSFSPLFLIFFSDGKDVFHFYRLRPPNHSPLLRLYPPNLPHTGSSTPVRPLARRQRILPSHLLPLLPPQPRVRNLVPSMELSRCDGARVHTRDSGLRGPSADERESISQRAFLLVRRIVCWILRMATDGMRQVLG